MNVQHHAICGAEIGRYLDTPIFESFEEEGITYVFDRIAEGDEEGYPLSQLHKSELLVNPGLIYRPK